jgi:hypothetical protein
MAGIPKLLFVDANIWLDFYRARTEAALSLLKHLEVISSQIIVTYQLEMEFKKHRQNAILEGLQDLKSLQQIQRPGLFSDAKEVKTIRDSLQAVEVRVKKLRQRYIKAFRNPTYHDPVFKICQRIFHKNDDLVLSRTDKTRHAIRRLAFRRFIVGCPPRKKSDTSIGDAINWEWMVHRAIARKAELVIVSRDSDYGSTFDGSSLINDHLAQEFSERVSRKRKVMLYSRLSDALKHFSVPVTAREAKEEEVLVQTAGGTRGPLTSKTLSGDELINFLIKQGYAEERTTGGSPNLQG